MRFELWRTDDHGNDFLVGTFSNRTEAEARLKELAAGGHRQTYWIKQVDSEN